ncbi:MAG TPA: hypothetical protein PKE41_08840 [Candidatus Macondimonas sp.]|nr:hypothetical protein [Candidatus Macondimonas sp.]
MHRLIVILLLVLVPLQGSWALVAHYSEHAHPAGGKTTLVGASHDVTTAHSESESSERGHGSLPSGHDHCHLAGFVGVTASFLPVALLASRPVPADIDSRYLSHATPPPEPPQWSALA